MDRDKKHREFITCCTMWEKIKNNHSLYIPDHNVHGLTSWAQCYRQLFYKVSFFGAYFSRKQKNNVNVTLNHSSEDICNMK
jgi:hypothetical protein